MKRRDALRATFPLLVGPLIGPPLAQAAAAATADLLPDDALAARLRAGGVAVMLRHATTDAGIGDPPGFKLGDCSTQRNLSAAGRAQAQRIGTWFKARGLVPAAVRSSSWCRCIDTGTLAFGQAEVWPALGSLFDDPARRDAQSAALLAALAGIRGPRFEVWVSHQVNITALTTVYPGMGEACVIEPSADGEMRVVGRSRFGA